MIKIKKPWYIWFSFIALVVLCIDTIGRVSFLSKSWGMAIGNMFKIATLYMMIPLILLIPISSLLLIFFPTSYLIQNIVLYMCFIGIYLSGVYGTCEHVIWRKENMPDLLNETETDSTS